MTYNDTWGQGFIWTNKALKIPRWKPDPEKNSLDRLFVRSVKKKSGNARKATSEASLNKNTISKSIPNKETLHRCYGFKESVGFLIHVRL